MRELNVSPKLDRLNLSIRQTSFHSPSVRRCNCKTNAKLCVSLCLNWIFKIVKFSWNFLFSFPHLTQIELWTHRPNVKCSLTLIKRCELHASHSLTVTHKCGFHFICNFVYSILAESIRTKCQSQPQLKFRANYFSHIRSDNNNNT